MIVNDTQLAVTLATIDKFKTGRDYLINDPRMNVRRYLHPILRKAQLDGVESVIAELEAEVAEYEHIKSENSAKGGQS